MLSPFMRLGVPMVFAVVWFGARTKPAVVRPAVLFACYLLPGIFIARYRFFDLQMWAIWVAALAGLIAGMAPLARWSLPWAWRLPLVFWALVVAITWPLVRWRESDYNALELHHSIQSWLAMGALITMVGVLWFDALFAFAGTGREADDRFERQVAFPMAAGWLVAGLIGVYQLVGSITFLNPAFWGVLRRATGTLGEANAFGVLSALWGGVMWGVAVDTKGWRRWLAVVSVPVSWLSVWASGSRSSFLIVVLSVISGGAVILFRGPRRVAPRLALIATALVAAAAMAVVISRGGAMGPVARFNRDFAPRWSIEWMQQMASNLQTRGGYGTGSGMMIRDHPMIGVGPGAFQQVWPLYSYKVFGGGVQADNAQNWFRHQLAELGLVGSVGWAAWVALFAWVMVTKRSRLDRRASATALRVTIVGFLLISLLGVPAQELPVAFTFWTFAFWLVVALDKPLPADVRPLAAGWWTAAWLLVAVFAGSTFIAARGELRPVVRAAAIDGDYSYGFYPPDGEIDGMKIRWAGRHALASVPAGRPWMRLAVGVNHVDIAEKPVDVQIEVNGRQVLATRLSTVEMVTRYIEVPTVNRVTLETRVNRVLRPRDFGIPDDRELGLLVAWDFVTEPPAGAILVR